MTKLRVIYITGIALIIAVGAALAAEALLRLINLITNLAFYGRWSGAFVSPAGHHLGAWVVLVPVAGGVIVGLMARYGSRGIRGHGIPEAMEQVLVNRSRIQPRLTWLKPLSAAIAMGTGGPFGAEGPIIATGGALGSLVGQLLTITAEERKTLLAAGAAAGMSAIFGSPVAAVLLAIELLLFEFSARSFIPVAFASATAAMVRTTFRGAAPVFAMAPVAAPRVEALIAYALLGIIIGLASVAATRTVYWVEEAFERVPIHWMWWPALGAIAVGVTGYFAPATLGVGYDNIDHILNGTVAGRALWALAVLKFISWSIALGSGTSGGTMAPLFTVGGGLGAALGEWAQRFHPHAHVDARMAGLVGMAAMFAGASRALFASIVFAFETTLQPLALLPLLIGCTAAYLVSSFLMQYTIMTEKISRRGISVPSEYTVDFLALKRVGDCMSRPVVSLKAGQSLAETRAWLASRADGTGHQGFPVLDAAGRLAGVVTQRNLLDPTHPGDRTVGETVQRPPIVIYEDSTLREAADTMVRGQIGRLPVIKRSDPSVVVGMLSRSDLLEAHNDRLDNAHLAEQSFSWPIGD